MENSKLYVGNLNYSVTFEDLKELFKEFGEVKSVKVLDGKGFGFVEFATPNDASNAMDSLNGTEFRGRELKIDIAKPQKPRPRY